MTSYCILFYFGVSSAKTTANDQTYDKFTVGNVILCSWKLEKSQHIPAIALHDAYLVSCIFYCCELGYLRIDS